MLNPSPVTHKTIRPVASLPALSGFSLLGVSGPDAAVFLQAQAMNDVRALAVGQWQWNGWLNAKGRVIVLFALLREAGNDFLIVLPDFPAADLAAMLQRYVFRSKVRMQAVEELVAAADWTVEQTDPATRNMATGDRPGGLRLDFSGETTARSLLLLPKGDLALAAGSPASDARWRDADLMHGLPRLSAGQREMWTPQMLSLDRLQAFSLKKGCYPGQEIVARTHYLGQARRGLYLARGTGLATGAVVEEAAGGVAAGTLVNVSSDGNSGLAIVQTEKRAATLTVEGRPLILTEPLAGLARAL